MKWYTKSWVRPSKSSPRVTGPVEDWKTYSLSTFTHGRARRFAASRSRSRVQAFSSTSRAAHGVLPLFARNDVVGGHFAYPFALLEIDRLRLQVGQITPFQRTLFGRAEHHLRCASGFQRFLPARRA